MSEHSSQTAFPGFSFPRSLSGFPEHASLIADIVLLWNLLEDKCVYLLQTFTNIDFAQADLMLNQLSSPKAKIDAIFSAGRWTFQMYPQQLKDFEKFSRSVNERLLKRNKYAHGVYMVNEKGVLGLLFRKYDKHDEKRFIPLRIHELKDEVSTYSRLLSDLGEIEKAAWDMLPDETAQALIQIWTVRREIRPKDPG